MIETEAQPQDVASFCTYQDMLHNSQDSLGTQYSSDDLGWLISGIEEKREMKKQNEVRAAPSHQVSESQVMILKTCKKALVQWDREFDVATKNFC